ncbi:MAG: hypothetical protein RLZZ306_875, partial [Bacteroidota bacterium]
MYRKLLIVTLLSGSFILSCKQESSETAPAETSSFELLQTKVITPTCATPGCHASEKDGLVLTKDLAYDRIINVTPKNANAIKDGLKIVKPFSADQSLFFHKLEDNS